MGTFPYTRQSPTIGLKTGGGDADAVGVLWSVVHRVALDVLGEMPDLERVAEFVGDTSRCEMSIDRGAVLLSAWVDDETPVLEQMSRMARRTQAAFVSAGISDAEARRALNLAEVSWVMLEPTDSERQLLLERRQSIGSMPHSVR